MGETDLGDMGKYCTQNGPLAVLPVVKEHMTDNVKNIILKDDFCQINQGNGYSIYIVKL